MPENLFPATDRGHLDWLGEEYGRSALGIPLRAWLPASGEAPALVFAAIHGNEPDTTVVLSAALRAAGRERLRCAVVLCANPDGASLGLRGNARGVDLNRNFPTRDWGSLALALERRTVWRTEHDEGGPSSARSDDEEDRVVSEEERRGDALGIVRGGSKQLLRAAGQATGVKPFVALGPGASAASEPETRALIALLERLEPRVVVAMHSDLACVDDPGPSALGKWLAQRSGLPLVPDVGYPTPGSFGTWCKERALPVVTYELEKDGCQNLRLRHAPVLLEVLLGKAPFE